MVIPVEDLPKTIRADIDGRRRWVFVTDDIGVAAAMYDFMVGMELFGFVPNPETVHCADFEYVSPAGVRTTYRYLSMPKADMDRRWLIGLMTLCGLKPGPDTGEQDLFAITPHPEATGQMLQNFAGGGVRTQARGGVN